MLPIAKRAHSCGDPHSYGLRYRCSSTVASEPHQSFDQRFFFALHFPSPILVGPLCTHTGDQTKHDARPSHAISFFHLSLSLPKTENTGKQFPFFPSPSGEGEVVTIALSRQMSDAGFPEPPPRCFTGLAPTLFLGDPLGQTTDRANPPSMQRLISSHP